jgi:multidrug efflux pump subunit AcrA (membrane-fusion protein)
MSKSAEAAPNSGAQELLHITSPAHWVALCGLLLLVVAALIWSVFGRLPVEVSGSGVLLPEGGMTRAQTPVAGLVATLQVRPGERVRQGQVIGTVSQGGPSRLGAGPAGKSVEIASPCDGTVIQNLAEVGSYVRPGAALTLLSQGDSRGLQAWVFVPFENSVAVEVGMPVYLSLQSVAPEENGYLQGSVKTVGRFPITEDLLVQTFGDDPRWISYLLGGNDPRALIEVELRRAPGSPSGYSWTVGNGPSTDLVNGMICSAAVRVSFAKPIQSAIPKSGKKD